MAGKPKPASEGIFYRDLGRAIRAARVASGKTQNDIADHLDMTFQQVQKYEKGTNRIPVDCLVSLADFFDVPLSHFLGPKSHSKDETAFLSMIEKFGAKEFGSLLEAWGAIKDKPARAALLNLVRCMADLSR
jgi:transcriptional regulator with XRE-family HTH domain